MNTSIKTAKDSLTDAEIVETYCALSRQLYKQYHDRRALEWRIHLSLWTILGLIAYLSVAFQHPLGDLAYFVLLAIPIHVIWTIKIHKGLIKEQNLSIHYRIQAESIIKRHAGELAIKMPETEEQSVIPDWLEGSFKSYVWWPILEVGTTTLICGFVLRLAY